MSSAIKAMIQHQAALTQIDEMHRRGAARRRFEAPARKKRQASLRSLAVRVRSLQPALRGDGA